MRALVLCLALFPTVLWADDIPLETAVAAVTVYPDGATVTRQVPFELPAGQHRLILADLPRDTPLAQVRVAVAGATLGAVTTRSDFVPPRSPLEDAVVEAAEAKVAELEDRLRSGEAEVRTIRLEAVAAEARADFLGRIGADGGPLPAETDALLELSAMIKGTTLSALNEAHEAELRADAADRALDDVREELEEARRTLAALVPETEERAYLAVSVSAAEPAAGELTISHPVDAAGWVPVYDIRLNRAEGRLAIARGAFVRQETGENWRQVALTLSTARPSGQLAPSEVRPDRRRAVDPDEVLPLRRSGMAGIAADAPAPAPVVEARPEADAISVRYVYPEPVDIAAGADRVRLALGTAELAAEVAARAAPLWDDTAFVVAGVTNDTGEVILPTDEAMFYLDGRFVGRQALSLIPAGDAAELAFGPVEGLRLSRILRNRTEGDRGVIRSGNEVVEDVWIEVENLTGEAWPVRLVDRVPHSEQEDLKVTWEAEPAPDAVDVDGKRGVLEWRFDLAAGEAREVSLFHRMIWPDGQVLR